MSSPDDGPLILNALYFYGYQGRSMVAVRAPSSMPDNARALIGRDAEAGGQRFRILAVERQISGPVTQGEPIGLEIAALESRPADGP